MVARRRIEGQSFLELTPRPGLCALCVHAPTCVFSREPGRPVRFCEEFEGVPPKPTKNLTTPSPAVVAVEDIDGQASRAGLCRYCENYLTCTFFKPEGGVWHCEEYK